MSFAKSSPGTFRIMKRPFTVAGSAPHGAAFRRRAEVEAAVPGYASGRSFTCCNSAGNTSLQLDTRSVGGNATVERNPLRARNARQLLSELPSAQVGIPLAKVVHQQAAPVARARGARVSVIQMPDTSDAQTARSLRSTGGSVRAESDDCWITRHRAPVRGDSRTAAVEHALKGDFIVAFPTAVIVASSTR